MRAHEKARKRDKQYGSKTYYNKYRSDLQWKKRNIERVKQYYSTHKRQAYLNHRKRYKGYQGQNCLRNLVKHFPVIETFDKIILLSCSFN